MANVNPEQNRLYSRAEDLHPLHWENLAKRAAEEAAAASGSHWNGQAFNLPLLGRTLALEPEPRRIAWADDPSRPVGYQRALVAVAYLAGAVEVPAKGEWAAFRQLPGGDAFFRGPHSLATPLLETAFGREPERLVEAARVLGGRPSSGGDVAAEIPALPKIPLKALLWAETEEFPASATLLTDARAHLHLPLDVLWALTNVAINDLVKASP